jgi:3-phenylpropionate/trans-cinnamate dioxygenase ferredoxin reductase subunit
MFVIVGANLAGGVAAAELREGGFDGRLVLIGEEPLLPYERPPLSKEYLRGEQTIEQHRVRPEGWYEEHDVELLIGERAEHVDATAREILLSTGGSLAFDKLLIATGARNVLLPVPGADLDGVFGLRTVADADRIREAAQPGASCVVVGMGFIGAEIAASLRSMGVGVTVVEPFEAPMYRVLGPQIGNVLRDVHADHGVDMRLGDEVEALEGRGRVEAVRTGAGTRLPCDFAVVGVGVHPNVELAEGSGIELSGGVVVDAGLETNVPGVFAAGDVAMHDHPIFGPLRLEHWENALKMGQQAARAMVGEKQPFDDPHWFWSDQYDVNIQVAGYAPTWDEVVYRGSVEERCFSAFFLKDGRLRSVLSMNKPRDVRRSMDAIRARARPDPTRIRDEDVDLRSLVA